MELEESSTPFEPPSDARPRLEEPLPVRLVALRDVSLPCAAGLEAELDRFYVGMLEFQREDSRELTYRADNFRVCFEIKEGPIVREGYRPLVIEVQSLAITEQKLIEREIEYDKQRGIFVGHFSLALLDPTGNHVELVEARRVM